MDYTTQLAQKMPSSLPKKCLLAVTEAARKMLVKQRFCCSGMRWKKTSVKFVLFLRDLVQSKGRWQQFWEYINNHGAQFCL